MIHLTNNLCAWCARRLTFGDHWGGNPEAGTALCPDCYHKDHARRLRQIEENDRCFPVESLASRMESGDLAGYLEEVRGW